MKNKKIIKLLKRIEAQNNMILAEIQFIRQNISVSVPFITTATPDIPRPIVWWSTTNTDVNS